MILFLTNTLSQLLNAAVIANSIEKNEKCDVYYTANLEMPAKSFLEDGVFAHAYPIILVEDAMGRENKIKRALVRIKNALDLRKIQDELPSDPSLYTKIFVSGVSLRNMEFYYAIKKENKKIELNLYEEGAFEYCELGMKKEISKILFSYFFFHRYYLKDCKKMYVYRPDLVENNWSNIKVKRIPCLMDQKNLIPAINKAFHYEETSLKQNAGKIVVLEQAFDNEHQEKEQVKIIRLLSKIVGTDNIIIKLHPRSVSNKYGEEYNYLNTKIPFEIIAINEDVSTYTFLSITSSAVTNFKVILNMEPVVIMLYKIFMSKESINNENGKFINKVKSISNNFYLPESIEELKEVVRSAAQ